MKIHIVRPGDSMWDLAQKYNIPVERLHEANPQIKEANHLQPGMKIRVPTGRIPIVSQKREESTNISPGKAGVAKEALQNKESEEFTEKPEQKTAYSEPQSESSCHYSYSATEAESSHTTTVSEEGAPYHSHSQEEERIYQQYPLPEQQTLYPYPPSERDLPVDSSARYPAPGLESPDRYPLPQEESPKQYASPYFSTYPYVATPEMSGSDVAGYESQFASESPLMDSSAYDLPPVPPGLSQYPDGTEGRYVPLYYPMIFGPTAFVAAPPPPLVPAAEHYSSYFYAPGQEVNWQPPSAEPWSHPTTPPSFTPTTPLPFFASPIQREKESSSRED
ncbi:LysM peptidoglycan-binding domain-containing protein [Paenactinomyces guangxiensis]|uniref:LysM peptidoglycan-binding domain-containing protein n=1 Tax=Paenactinomyces guangxiensis TaxID=1490290 RepID=A0A7W1WTH0_9BACL|nr:LysM domain-containing protein [Paenactinomyces guangxiensis]MBA4495773.1 LysM peptidoglycan-binding domain-containing protein [Paenactinomyces guangxiensis]MBH8592762.1 LysM peptidoglycan-binding domain-containing protein [Paenactinomyces guangxiensis]